MPDYRVTWETDIFDVASPLEAARKARELQVDPESIATVFDVRTCDHSAPLSEYGPAERIDLQAVDATEDFCDTGMVTGKGDVTYRISFAFEAVPLALLEDLKPVLIEHALAQATKSLQKSNLPGGTCRFVSVVPGRAELLDLPCIWYVITPSTIPDEPCKPKST